MLCKRAEPYKVSIFTKFYWYASEVKTQEDQEERLDTRDSQIV